jgi:hypothetical protein
MSHEVPTHPAGLQPPRITLSDMTMEWALHNCRGHCSLLRGPGLSWESLSRLQIHPAHPDFPPRKFK